MGNDNDLRSRETALQFDPDARSVYGSTSYNPGSSREHLEDSEDRGTLPRHHTSSATQQQPPRFQKLRRRGGTIAIIIALLGGGAAVTIPSMPAIGLNYIMEKFNLDFDYQSHGSSRRIAKLTDSQFKNSNVDCKGVKSCELVTTVSDREARTYREAGITVDREPLPGSNDSTRGRITRMEYTDPYTGIKSVVTNKTEFAQAMANNTGFMRAYKNDSHNARFIVNDDKVARTRLAAHGASKADPLQGNDEKSLRESFNDAVSGKKAANLGANLKPVKDDKDQTIGYTDEKGIFRSIEEVEAAKQNAAQIKEAEKITSKGVLGSFSQGAVRSVNALGTVSTACSLRATQKAIIVANELVKKRLLIKVAAVFNAIAGKIKALNTGVNIDTTGLDKKVEMLGNLVTTIIENEEMIVDPNSPADSPRKIKNPNYGKIGLDSDMIKLSDGDVKPLGERAQRFAFGSGLGGKFGEVDRAINKLLGNRDKQICKIVNNPLVQFAGFGVGIAAGAGSGGTLTAVMAAASIGLAFASPYLISTLADIMSGKLTEDLAGTDLVDAVGVGTQLYQTDVARASGYLPASSSEVVDYLAATKTDYAEYARLETQAAARTPLDITNQYSFLGSLTRSIIPHINTSSRTLGTIALNMSGIFSAASSSLVGTTHAADYVSDERFNQCPLEKYKQAGVAADVTCIPPLIMSKEAMNMTVEENHIWMEQSGNVEPGSFPGTPRDNGQSWNYKKYTDICVNGKDEDPDAWLTECTKAERKSLNDRFVAYLNDTRLKIAQSTDPKQTDAKSSDSNAMSGDGWVFPTALDARITSGFGPRQGGTHKGIDLAMSNEAETRNKPIYAARAGKVIAAGPMSGYGNWIVIDHGNDIYTLYGHMEDDGVMVHTGQDVRAGQQIGKIGNKGNSSGPHLHYEKWVGKNPTNGQGSGGQVDPTEDINKAQKQAREREGRP